MLLPDAWMPEHNPGRAPDGENSHAPALPLKLPDQFQTMRPAGAPCTHSPPPCGLTDLLTGHGPESGLQNHTKHNQSKFFHRINALHHIPPDMQAGLFTLEPKPPAKRFRLANSFNKTDAGNGSKAICRVSNVLRSPSPDPRRSPNFERHSPCHEASRK